ncbi:hypothetical protein L207DRAFT_462431 [Hyaloscypha variabilis F]|uniref:Uncharacterized protein n=1 Tax=Hyaloscypha variabilis (strain UAMH 11265 / GT02V1 / F) TaxID=1149755 RepID=A0A2J6RHI2_HYAVF|nr:hypothetical protein L207DRAFT_462431 [Hyaloscypha variabilis F]
MSTNDRLDVIYAEQMRNNPEGHALYKSVSATKLRPAVCGYFDRNGDWQAVVDLADPNALRLGGWTAIDGMMVETDPGETYWGPKQSEDVQDIGGKIAVGMSDPTNQIGGIIEASFQSSRGRGAILITDPPVRYHQAFNEKIFINWMSDNATSLLAHAKHGEMVREFGAWIVTKTYTTTKRAVAVLTSKEAKVHVNFSVNMVEASLAPEVHWWNRTSDSAWSIHTDLLGVVVFMSGIEFRPRLWDKTKLKAQPKRKHQKITRSGQFDKDDIPPITITRSGIDYNEREFQLVPTLVGESGGELEDEDKDEDETEQGEDSESID